MGGWAVWRTRLPAIAAAVQRITDYLDEERHRETVTLTLAEAVDGLHDNGWPGAVHILGYSFGIFASNFADGTDSADVTKGRRR